MGVANEGLVESMNALKKLFRSEYSLAETYWIGYIASTTLVRLYLFLLGMSAAYFIKMQWLLQLLNYLGIGVLLFVCYGIGYAVIRRALKNLVGFWSVIAILIVLANMIMLPFILFGVAESNADLEKKLASEVRSRLEIISS